MKDFFLTPRGDLSIINATNTSHKLEINFITTYSNALCLNFFTEDTSSLKAPKSGLTINFNTHILNHDKEIRVISGDDAMEQAIKIRLSSALGSIKENESIGSRLEEVVHKLVDSPGLNNKVISIIQEAIADIIPDAEIHLGSINSKYLNYSNGFIVTIKDGYRVMTLEI